MTGRLAGVSVVVTRPAAQAAPLVALLEVAGATVVLVPLIEVVELDDAPLIAAIAGLGPDDWVVAASLNSAGRLAVVLDTTVAHVAAVGATTAATLPRIDLVAPRQGAQGLIAVFPSAPVGGRVVVVQSAGGAPTLVDGLIGLGWTVDRVDTHRTAAVRPDARQQLNALRSDVVLFTSGSQARAWTDVFGTSAPAVVAAIGPQTAADAEAVGLKVGVIAADHSLAGSVLALEEFFQR